MLELDGTSGYNPFGKAPDQTHGYLDCRLWLVLLYQLLEFVLALEFGLTGLYKQIDNHLTIHSCVFHTVSREHSSEYHGENVASLLL